MIAQTWAEAERRQQETILVAPEIPELSKGKKAPDSGSNDRLKG